MGIEASTIISEYLAGLALEAGKNKFKSIIDEKNCILLLQNI